MMHMFLATLHLLGIWHHEKAEWKQFQQTSSHMTLYGSRHFSFIMTL